MERVEDEAPTHEETAAAWDVVARSKYRAEFDEHVSLLRAGRHNLLPDEAVILTDFLPGAHVIQLQCSHGLDALGLLNAGAKSVVGIDVSSEMIAQARAKAAALGAVDASFVCADVVSPPSDLDGTADLVYTGRGSLPWILDLSSWSETVRRLVKSGGRAFVFEGHPLAHLWDRDAQRPELRPGVGYFDEEPREAPGFPASLVQRELGHERPQMLERHWRPGEIIEALVASGFRVTCFRESPTLFWDQFPNWPADIRERLPNSYAILAELGLVEGR